MPTTNSVRATLQIRHDTASNWTIRNPVLAQGEFGLEIDTYLIKIGDGLLDWEHLPYLNKLDETYFQWEEDGTITFSDSFQQTITALEAAAGETIENLVIVNPPQNDTDVPNKKYVDDTIAAAILAAGHLSRQIVQQLPSTANASDTIIYMVPVDDHYEEYMFIDGAFDMVGSTGEGSATYQLEVATAARLGGVKSSSDPDTIAVNANGIMTLNQVSTSLLYVPQGDVLVLYGGSA